MIYFGSKFLLLLLQSHCFFQGTSLANSIIWTMTRIEDRVDQVNYLWRVNVGEFLTVSPLHRSTGCSFSSSVVVPWILDGLSITSLLGSITLFLFLVGYYVTYRFLLFSGISWWNTILTLLVWEFLPLSSRRKVQIKDSSLSWISLETHFDIPY